MVALVIDQDLDKVKAVAVEAVLQPLEVMQKQLPILIMEDQEEMVHPLQLQDLQLQELVVEEVQVMMELEVKVDQVAVDVQDQEILTEAQRDKELLVQQILVVVVEQEIIQDLRMQVEMVVQV